MSAPAGLDDRILEIGSRLNAAFPKRSRNPLRVLDDKAMELASRDVELKAALFRLVDVTPATRSLDDLARHLSEYLDDVDERPPSLDVAMKMAGNPAGRRALGAAAATGVRRMGHRFIVGATPKDAVPVLRGLWNDGIASTVDLLGEATVTQPEADRYAERCADALDVLADAYARLSGQPQANVSVKVSALTPLLRPDAPEIGREDAAQRLRPLLRQARERDAHLHVDMESLDSMEATLDLVFGLLEEDEFAAGPSTGIVLQAYLRESPDMLSRILTWSEAHTERPPLVVRLVKGAYWDHEVIEARQHGWVAPVFEDKAACDRNYEELTRRLLDARPLVKVAIASHNLRSVSHAIAYDQASGGDKGNLEFQILRGLGDDLAKALASFDLQIRAYCPVGDLVAGMAYLVRRLLENTANDSFLHDQAAGRPMEELLAAP
ncbi:MAG TPA: proline dehydrogenase family protein [Thermoleophilaceae bacterium]|nr:proline dehydrogenase family protein [Thermoleophilaceae bacterium]